ncbi:putative small lipoprotein YifL [Oxalobacteraceae bacterium GrIS 1.11]
MMPFKSLFLSLALLMLAACSDGKPPAAVVAPAEVETTETRRQLQAQLMSAVFGNDYRAATGDALAIMRNVDRPQEKTQYVIKPVAHLPLPSGEMVLVANADLPDGNGNAMATHVSPGLLSVYFLRQGGGKWQVLRRQENIAALGSSGDIGKISWTYLAPKKLGLVVENGGVWQGYLISQLSLFDLSAGTLHDLAGHINVHSENDGACGPDTEECWNITGAWHFVPSKSVARYRDLVLEFSGYRTVAAKPADKSDKSDPPEHKRSEVTGHARYSFDGKHYQLVEGKNLVPGI